MEADEEESGVDAVSIKQENENED